MLQIIKLIGRRLKPLKIEGLLDDFETIDSRSIMLGQSDLSAHAAPWRRSANFDAQKEKYYENVKSMMRQRKEAAKIDSGEIDNDRDGYMMDMIREGIGGAVHGITGEDIDNEVTGDMILDGMQVGSGNNFSPLADSVVQRFTSRDRLVGEWAQKLYIHNWGGDLTHDASIREGSFRFGNDEFWGGVGIGLEEGMVQNSWGVRRVAVQQVYDELIQEIGQSVTVRDYHIGVDHSQTLRSSAVDVGTKRVNTSTLAKVEDRDYGQRVKVKNLEVMVRHDFDHYLKKDTDGEVASEVHVEYKSLYISADTDLIAKKGGVAVGLGGNKVAIIRDTDDRNGYVNVLMNGGWQWLSAFDMPDEKGGEVQWMRHGFGKLNRFFGRVGAGVQADGMPAGSVDLQTRNLGFSTQYKQAGPRQVYTYSINVGDTTYSWESEVLPQNLKLPRIFGTSAIPAAE